MSPDYQPLHHKYRPQRFDDLVGQVSIVKTLKQALITHRIAPAYLFSGPRGTGKTSSARILARSLNCLKSAKATIEPCGICNLCKEISKGTALDVIEIDAASNTGVDNIRELIEKAQFAPVQARWKVYVIDECHMLSSAAFNALLKTLEEPPLRTVFVLATTDPQKLLQTILSRCQRFDFRRIPTNLLINHLDMIAKEEKIEIDKESIKLIAERSEGGLRDAESLLDQLSLLEPPVKLSSIYELLGEVPESELINLTYSLANNDPTNLLKICRKLIDNGKEAINILQGLTSILRDLVIIKALPNDSSLCNLSDESFIAIKTIVENLSMDHILNWQRFLKGSESQIRLSLQPRLWLEVILLGLLSINNNAKIESDIVPKFKKVESSNRSIKDNPLEANEKSKDSDNTSIDSKERNNEELSQTWEKILSKIELPSTRMLLSQQASLSKLTNHKAEVSISENWIGMIQSRKSIIEKAITKSLGSNRELLLVKQTITQPIQEKLEKENLGQKRQEKIEDNGLEVTKLIENDRLNNNDLINKQAESFANFFNGKIVDLEDKT